MTPSVGNTTVAAEPEQWASRTDRQYAMGMNGALIEVCMRRDDLAGEPLIAVVPPAGYWLRPYRPGDSATWARVHREAEPYHDVDEALFQREFGHDDALLAQRQLYLCAAAEGGEAVGTATAWVPQAGRPGRLGRVHWVAITPRHQGRGLMLPLVAALCRRFLELGHGGAYLTTESLRLRAIRGYLRLGFAPELRHEGDRAAWREVLAQGAPLPEATRLALAARD